MILKVSLNKDDQEEVFQITNYYVEGTGMALYLEADLDGKGEGGREIILNECQYRGDDYWEEITIQTDLGMELLKITNEERF